ncbi:2-C-methyl-D-erythritol 4-phosphate cytidylyltransferase [Marinobacter sp. CHS3-4]|uniref:2-C-methyl-D-erythritol 4-phosphate cytidylyltransferase n=1 Tax=Marinobacter sp. CHS3-4 TaxID=3045174 RepID=UPI0024B5659F|nr:2-C-methyl-D-erythritol 4-phosphate cytidylyltransferase [Marinobacter sp. CHS3-4]MDI9246829.1 2-C-methyl-D-erythritol 4-phosphate cytidylyltransferase [Marinobacter sp. CHS3-4]
MTDPKLWLVIPAAGSGQRMQSTRPKQYLTIADQFILDLSISAVLDHAPMAGCVVALSPDDSLWHDTRASKDPRVQRCDGGKERADSVLAALEALGSSADREDWVLVHDAARPCLHPDDLGSLIRVVSEHSVGGLLATPVTDTIKKADTTGTEVTETVDRRHLWRALTPQMFRFGILSDALRSAFKEGLPVTDEASAIEQVGYSPCIVEGRPDNIKVTVPADLALAEFILNRF